jgi:hypothetical protein
MKLLTRRGGIKGELIKLAEKLPPGARDRIASYEHVVRTFQLTHVEGISEVSPRPLIHFIQYSLILF